MNRRRRDATLADLPAIVAIYNQSIPERLATADLEPVRCEDRLDWFHAHDARRYPLWVAMDAQDQVAGWLGLQPFHHRCAYRGTAEISVYIDHGRRHQGWGRWLVQEAIAAAPALGIDRLVGLIFGHNQPSLALFMRLGFSRWGLLPGVALLDDVRRDLAMLGRVVPGDHLDP